MKMNNVVVAGVAMALMMAGNAVAADGKPYAGIAAGVAILDDSTLSDNSGSVELSYNTGYVVSGVVGYEFGNGLRLEGELNYRQADTDKASAGGASASINSDVWSIGMMANAYYDFKNSSSITPYIGGGIGFANVNVGDGSIGGVQVWEEDDDTVFAYQLAVGTGFDVTKQLTVDLGYRYYATQDPSFGLADAEYSSHNVMAGLRYRF